MLVSEAGCPMNISAAIKRHEDLAFWFARNGKAKAARAELLRIEQLKKIRELRRKPIDIDDCKEVYAD